MARTPPPSSSARTHQIQIKLQDINQLFNTMDPSPFYEKDLDADAEEFIISWAQEFPLREPLALTIHVERPEAGSQSDEVVEKAVQHYFSYRGDLTRLEFRRLLRDGRISLVIGLLFLSVCLTCAQLLIRNNPEPLRGVAREGLVIAGWVAMWRPLQIYLYDWWPVHRKWKVFEKMSRMKVEIHRPGR